MTRPDFTQREVRVTHALANPYLFGEFYFRPYDPNWIAPLPPFANDMLRFMVATRRGVVMLPPEFLKTTLAQVYALWRTFRSAAGIDPMLRGMLMSEEEGMAKGNLSVVRWHIENNERLLEDFLDPAGFPLVRPSSTIEKWSDESIVIEREGVSRDMTWQAKGLDSKGIHGRRLNVFLGDDLVTPKNADSPAMRKAALKTMDDVILTRIVEGGQVLVLANFNDAKDLPSTLAARQRWESFRRPSMHVKGEPDVAPKDSQMRDEAVATPTWPGNWSRKRLLDEYDEKPSRFRRIHLLDPRAEMGERLSVDWLHVVNLDGIPIRYGRFYIGIDPAPGGEGDDLDFFNITVACASQLNLDIVECFDVRASTPRQVELVGLMHDRYQRIGHGVVKIGISKVALDSYFRGALEVSRPDLTHKVEPISTVGQKETRLEGLGPLAQTGWLRFSETVLHTLTSNVDDRDQEETVFEQWRDFPFARHDDKLDGIDMVQRVTQKFGLVGDVVHELRVAGDDDG